MRPGSEPGPSTARSWPRPSATDPEHPDVARVLAARPSRLAALVAEVTDPALVVAAVTVFVGIRSSEGLLAGLGWSALAVSFCALFPYAVLLGLLRAGRVSDRHIVRREERHLPALAALVFVVVGLAILVVAGAPHPLVVLVCSQLVGLLTMALLTRWIKASLHTAVSVGSACVVAWLLGGPWWALPPAAVAVVGWARWRGGRHTAAQVALGAAVGAATTVTVFALAGS